MENMNSFERLQVVILIFQTIFILAAFLGALYFGFNQKDVNDKLATIEEHNNKQVILQENARKWQEKKQMRDISISILRSIPNSERVGYRAAFKMLSQEEQSAVVYKVNDLLYEGVDNYLLVNNKEAHYKWLRAINVLSIYRDSDINPSDITVLDKAVSGELSARAGTQEDYDEDMLKSLNMALGLVLETYGDLDLSLTKIFIELDKELNDVKK